MRPPCAPLGPRPTTSDATPMEGTMADKQLPSVIVNPVWLDLDKTAEATGVPQKQMQGSKGWRPDDSIEKKLLELVRANYVKCIDGGNPDPTAQHVWGVSHKGNLTKALLDATGNGNNRGALTPPVLGGDDSPIWQVCMTLMRDPESFGIKGVPALRADVEIRHRGQDLPSTPEKD